MGRITAKELYEELKKWPGMEGHVKSLAFHAKRYERLLEAVSGIVEELRAGPAGEPKILDVGPWWQTALFRRYLDVHVNTLGLLETPPPIDLPRDGERYWRQDLATYDAYRSDVPEHDLVVMAEVIEHLPIAPTLVLKRLRSYIKPKGYLLLTTPNAVEIRKRIKMLFGRNPFNLISENPDFPSHFREYTVGELVSFARSTGYRVRRVRVTNDWYWRYSPAARRSGRLSLVKNDLLAAVRERSFPRSWRQSIMILLQKSC